MADLARVAKRGPYRAVKRNRVKLNHFQIVP
jgi:hypothetical protein